MSHYNSYSNQCVPNDEGFFTLAPPESQNYVLNCDPQADSLPGSIIKKLNFVCRIHNSLTSSLAEMYSNVPESYDPRENNRTFYEYVLGILTFFIGLFCVLLVFICIKLKQSRQEAIPI